MIVAAPSERLQTVRDHIRFENALDRAGIMRYSDFRYSINAAFLSGARSVPNRWPPLLFPGSAVS